MNIISQFVSGAFQSLLLGWVLEYKSKSLSCDILDIEFHKIKYCMHYNYSLLHPNHNHVGTIERIFNQNFFVTSFCNWSSPLGFFFVIIHLNLVCLCNSAFFIICLCLCDGFSQFFYSSSWEPYTSWLSNVSILYLLMSLYFIQLLVSSSSPC